MRDVIVIDSEHAAVIAARAALEKHAEGVVVMDLRTLSNVTDFFVICTAGSAPQIIALKDHIETVLAQYGYSVWHTEGVVVPRSVSLDAAAGLQWALLDCGELVIHLLDPAARAFYRLEELWADAPRIVIPSESVLPGADRESIS